MRHASSLHRRLPLRSRGLLALVGATTVVGVAVVALTLAAGTFVASEAENGTLSGGAAVVTDSAASGGRAVRFGSQPSGSVCTGAAGMPGGPDGQGGCWPGPATTGYKAAPDYPGSLHSCATPIQSNTTYSFCDFVGGADVGTQTASVSNVTFHGCRFKGTGGDGALVFLFGSNLTFDYDSFEPSAGAPPVSYAASYQFGIEAAGGYYTHVTKLTVDHSDFWGWGNAIDVDGSTQANPEVFSDNWIHDSADDGGGQYHVDGIGAEGTGTSTANLSYVVINHNTILSAGNTNGLAFQRNGNYDNFSITNNLFGGFGYTVNIDAGTGTANNNTFTGNVFSTGLAVGYGPLYSPSVEWWTGHGGTWRNNKWAVPSGAPWGVAAHNGWYWLPNAADNHGATDDSQFVSQTDYSG